MDDLILPPLPEPQGKTHDWDWSGDDIYHPNGCYTADQMREYAKRAVEAERKAILAMSEAVWFKSQFHYDEAIRARR